jgi:hypothetical protein
LITSFWLGMVDDEGFGGTSTFGMIGIEVGEGLGFFFYGLAPATLLHDWRSKIFCSFKGSMEKSSRRMGCYPDLVKNCSMPPLLLLLVSIYLSWSLSFSSFLVILALGDSRGRLALDPEAAPLFRLAGGAASGFSVSDTASEFDDTICGFQIKIPRSFSSRESS